MGTEKDITRKIQGAKPIDLFDSDESDFIGLIQFNKSLASILNL